MSQYVDLFSDSQNAAQKTELWHLLGSNMNKPNASPRMPGISGLENYTEYGKGRRNYTYI